MIKSITVTNHLGDSIKLEMTRPESSGFIIKSIEGLGPAKANINTTDIATNDGTLYNSARLNQRDMVISLGFLQTINESIEDIRQKSYKYFPVKRKIQLMIETDNRTVIVEGYVESNEPNIFSENEGCSISILCPDPFFYSTASQTTTFGEVEASLEFPFENDSLTDPLLELGVFRNKQEQSIVYDGDLEVGISIVINATGKVLNPKIINDTTGEAMIINTTKAARMLPISFKDHPLQTCINEEGIISDLAIPSTYHTLLPKMFVREYDVAGYSKIVLNGYMVVPRFGYYYVFLNDNGRVVGWGDYGEGYSDYVLSKLYENVTLEVPSDASVLLVQNNTEYLGTPSQITVTVANTNDAIREGYIRDNDIIFINTRKGKKSITMLRDGITYNIINSLDRESKWITLRKGDNVFIYNAESGVSNLHFSIANEVAYDGV